MIRNIIAEKEMVKISKEVWKFLKGKNKFPTIESKQGGSSGCYYPSRHTIYFRWNVWNKMPLAGKRMLAIHELWHAKGNDHNSFYMFCHSFDILTIELYKKIYGEDKEYQEVVKQIKSII
jgi:hypothetical protein